MLNRLNYFFVVCLLCSGLGLLLVLLTNNRAVNQLQQQIARYELEIAREEEKIHNLQAEIAHLSHPDRITRLVKQYLPDLQISNVETLYVPENKEGGKNAQKNTQKKGGLTWRYKGENLPSSRLFEDVERATRKQPIHQEGQE
ncbi:MAG: hypothetical protein K0U45_07155 [Alphaproteobacteria bacterium]|nr:hypothetical protein [Alphaproteobacteria bacterium]